MILPDLHNIFSQARDCGEIFYNAVVGFNIYIVALGLTVLIAVFYFYRLISDFRNKSTWKQQQDESFSKRTVHNTLFVFSSIVWASAVSVFGTDLQKQWTGVDAIGYESLLFFMPVVLAFYVGTKTYLSGLRREAINRTEPSSDTVEISSASVISTQENYDGCLEDWILTYNDFDNVPVDDLKILEKSIISSIKFCMKQMLEVLHSWTNDSGAVIKVNLLNVLDSAELLKELESNPNGKRVNPLILKNSPFFLFNDNWQSCLQRCDKVLINEQDLTQIIGSCESPRAHSPICMPYSINHKNDDGEPMQPNIIGAPEALKTGSIKYVTPIQSRIEEFIKEKIQASSSFSDFATDNYQKGLRKYYDTDTAASIISIPLEYIQPQIGYDDDEMIDVSEPSEIKFASVLNIYAHSNYILVNEDVVQSYCQLTKPIWHTLTKLVSMRLQLLSDIEASVKKENSPEIYN